MHCERNSQEQHEQESKKSNLIIKGTTPVSSINDHEVVTKIARSVDVEIQSNQIETKRIARPVKSMFGSFSWSNSSVC